MREWRRLTNGGSPTLIACSGGADSSALAIALATSAKERMVLAHIVHDLRPRAEALADCQAVRDLAAKLGAAFVHDEITPASGGRGNLESAARRERYRALAHLAREHQCGSIATAHHAEDQAETVLMAMMRGTSARGAGGIAPRRCLTSSISLIRPMLHLTKADAHEICTAAGVTWCEDVTNLDTSRVRAALRHTVLPALEAIRPGSVKRIARSAGMVRAAAAVVTMDAKVLWINGREREAGGRVWNRGQLHGAKSVVLGDLIRMASRELAGNRGADRMNTAVVRSIIRAIQDDKSHARTWTVGGLQVEVNVRQVRIMRRENE